MKPLLDGMNNFARGGLITHAFEFRHLPLIILVLDDAKRVLAILHCHPVDVAPYFPDVLHKAEVASYSSTP